MGQGSSRVTAPIRPNIITQNGNNNNKNNSMSTRSTTSCGYTSDANGEFSLTCVEGDYQTSTGEVGPDSIMTCVARYDGTNTRGQPTSVTCTPRQGVSQRPVANGNRNNGARAARRR